MFTRDPLEGRRYRRHLRSQCSDPTGYRLQTIDDPRPVLQVRQHAHAAVDVLRGHGNHFRTDAMKLEIDAHVAYGQITDAQRHDADG